MSGSAFVYSGRDNLVAMRAAVRYNVSVRRTRLELRSRGDNDPVQLTNSWTRWIRRTVVNAGGTAKS